MHHNQPLIDHIYRVEQSISHLLINCEKHPSDELRDNLLQTLIACGAERVNLVGVRAVPPVASRPKNPPSSKTQKAATDTPSADVAKTTNTETPAKPITPAPVPTTAPVATPAPIPAAAPTAAPTYTKDNISRAGAWLVDAGKMQEVLTVCAKFGISHIQQLKPEQYPDFAAELRALGASI